MTPAAVVYAGLVLARVGAFAAVAPPFAGRVPRTVRAGLAVVLTAFYVGAVAPGWDPALAGRAADVHPVAYVLALAREALIGAAMGYMFGLFLLPARVAGGFVALQVGLPVTPQVGPAGTEAGAGPVSIAFETLASVLFLVADGHHILFAALHGSFDRLPLGGGTIPAAGPMVDGLATAYEMGVLLTGPLALSLFLLAVVLAVMARAAPQLNIYSIGFTLQVLVTLAGVFLLLPEFGRTLLTFVARTGDFVRADFGG